MNTVNAALLDAVCTFFLTEARRIAGQRERQFGFRQDLVDEFTDHGVLAGTDEIQVFTLDLVHHGIHFRKAHNAGNDVAANHIRRDNIREAAVNHKIARIRDNGGVQTRDVAHQIIEAVTRNAACSVQIDTVEAFHDLRVIRNREIRNDRLAETLNLDVFAVVFADRHAGVDDIRDRHHDLEDLFVELLFLRFCGDELIGLCFDLCLDLLSLGLLTLTHQCTDLLGELISGSAQAVGLLLRSAFFGVQLDDFIDKRKLRVLELFLDILADNVRIFSQKFNIDHFGTFLSVICSFLSVLLGSWAGFASRNSNRQKNVSSSAGLDQGVYPWNPQPFEKVWRKLYLPRSL